MDTLVKSLLNGTLVDDFKPLDDPQKLAEATIYVPNRRAARALATAFLSSFDGAAAILPEIRTLGDSDTEEFGLIAEHDEPSLLKEPIQPIERKLQLAHLIQSWRDSVTKELQEWFNDEELQVPFNPADSIRLAGDLSGLLDQITQEEIDWINVNDLIPEEHSDWWRLTSTFLQIIVMHWPDHLAQYERFDPAQRAIKLLKLRTNRYQKSGSKGPVIIAGSTGSVPSTRMLLAAVATLRQGAIVLPGLDTALSQREWDRLQGGEFNDDPLIESHSQFGLARTLNHLEIERDSVIKLSDPNSIIADRNAVTSMALSLSELSSTWRERISIFGDSRLEKAFEDVVLIEAKNERQEALAVAIAMREILEQKNKTGALVTPDRNLAYRVSMELQRFGVMVDDSAGTPLSETPPARFTRLVCRVGFGEYSNPELAALIKHPLFRAGFNPEKARSFALFFEHAALRGNFLSPKVGSFESWLKEGCENREGLKKGSSDTDGILVWAAAIDCAFAPLIMRSTDNAQQTVSGVFTDLLTAVMRLTEDDHSKSSLNDETGANELSNMFAKLTGSDDSSFRFLSSETPLVFDALLEDQVCRSSKATHPRLHIYGPLEARLLQHDRVILAGLNEDSWPRVHRNDSFLNRSMRRSLGMPTPERKTGLAAHDFQQLLATKEVVLSRSGRSDKAPTVASRWLQRITALIGSEQTSRLRARGHRYMDWATALDQPTDQTSRTGRPCVKPPIDARPKQLPVTDIETWVRDPYALYAKRILQLRPLEPLEFKPDARIKGNMYHQVMENYVSRGGPRLDLQARAEFLRKLWTDQLFEQNFPQDIEYSWLTRFHAVADAYVDWEQRYQRDNPEYESFCEIDGKTEVAGTGFTLTARADRIDVISNGAVHLFDYKTGNTPSPEQARTLSPQLALEAFIAECGGFRGVPDGSVSDMRFLRLRNDKPIGSENVHSRDFSVSEIVQKASNELRRLIIAFQDLQQGYVSRRAPFMESEISGDYDHLARVREWSFGDEDSG